MTGLRLALTLLLVQVALPQGDQAGSVQGAVVNMYTDQPLSGARVELMGVEHGKVFSRNVVSDSKGEFRFADVPSGAGYHIVVSGEKVQTLAYGQRNWNDPWTSIRIDPGQRVVGIKVAVQPVAAIRGRVVDSQGRGLLGARVVALRPVYFLARRTLQGAITAVTNSRGDYQFSSMPAGVYYLRVTPQNPDIATNILLSTPARIDRPSPGAAIPIARDPEGYPITYFPSTTSVESAKPINLSAGGTVENTNITVDRVRTGRVRGTVTHDGKPLLAGEVLMQKEDSASESSWTRTAELKEGQFDIRGVLPGSYIVWVRSGEANARLWSRTPVDVRSGETSFVAARVAPAADVSGKISIENGTDPASANLTQFVVYLLPDSFTPIDFTLQRTDLTVPPRSAIPSPDGRFTVKSVPPWDYSVLVSPVGGEAATSSSSLRRVYVKSIRSSSADISSTGLSLDTTFDDSLDIVLSLDSGGLNGRVLADNQESGASARVAMVPDARHRKDLYLAVGVSSTGRFEFQGVPPGSYRVFAWKDAPTGAWFDPDFLKEYESAAPPVHVEAGSAEYIELKWLP